MSDSIPTPNSESVKYPGAAFREPMEKLADSYDAAISQNPLDIDAQTGFADARIAMWCFGLLTRVEALPKASVAAETALAIDENYGPAHTTSGVIKFSDWDWQPAESAFRKGIELSPDSAKAHHWYALYLSAMGRHDEALFASKHALSLDDSPGYHIGLGAVYYFAHDFESLAAEMEALIKDMPDFAPGYDWLGMAYIMLKRYDESIAVYEKAVALSDGLAEINGGLGHAYGEAGRMEDAQRVLDEMTAQRQKWYVPPVQIAFVCLGLGDLDAAFHWLDIAYKEKSWELVFAREEPWLDHLHNESRFKDIVNQMKFPAKSG